MYFPAFASTLLKLVRYGERDAAHGVAGRAGKAAAGEVVVRDGLRKVEVHPLGRRGSYRREVEVIGAERGRVIGVLPGPATGPDGFAPDMVSVTPVARQFHADRTTRAEQVRVPGLPPAMGATVEPDQMVGLVAGTARP